MSKNMKKVHEYTMKELESFVDCPLKWHLMKKKENIVSKIHRDVIVNIAKFFLYRLTGAKSCPSTSLINRLERKNISKKKMAQYTNWILSFQKKFSSMGADVIAFNYPFKLSLKDNVRLDGVLDIVIKSPYGGDIIIYDFNEDPDEKDYMENPIYTLYMMAFEHDFKRNVNSVSVYNFPTSELIDVSRPTDKMISQLDIIKLRLIEMREKEIIPKVSLKCHGCPVASVCNYNEVDL